MDRQEIAEFMRDTPAAIDENYQYEMPGNLFGLHITAKSEGKLYGGLVHLAELIDPICCNCGGEADTNYEYYDFACSRCGYACDLPEPNYCPNCGRRIVDNTNLIDNGGK